MGLIDEVKERLSIFKNLYDTVRIVDPEKKETVIVAGNEKQKENGTCCSSWKNNRFCDNCISMRAFINNDTYIKIEYDKEKIYLIIATPVEVNEKIYIAEILKDITYNGSVFHKLTEDPNCVEELIRSMGEKAITDNLTGLYNRRYIDERLPIDIRLNKKKGVPISIIMADLDLFANINDKFGHVIGDKLLSDFSNIILKPINNDKNWVGRYGGEEYIIVLNNTELKKAYFIAEKIRKQIEEMTFSYDNIDVNITASFGIYNITDYDTNVSDFLSIVDKNLYEAKNSGRNMTIINQDNVKGNNLEAIKDKSARLSKLNRHINELREILNETCITLHANELDPNRLLISQQLDELIVKYMKEVNNMK